MSIEMNSFSSSLMFGTTLYRNQSGIGNKIIAQAGYALINLVAGVESITALAVSILSLATYPFSSTPFKNAVKWLDSSVFCFGWSAADFFLNLFISKLAADERSAREILHIGNVLIIPQGAII